MRKMNRIFGTMCLAALLAVGSTSCKKQETTSSFTFELPSVEGFSAGEDRAYIDVVDGGKMKWYDDDQLMLYSLDANRTTPEMSVATIQENATGLTQALFSATMIEGGSEGVFAFYPASMCGQPEEDNYGTFNVPATQTYQSGLNFGATYTGRVIMDPRCVVAAARVPALNTQVLVTLQHIFGYINVRVKSTSGTKYVQSVTVTDSTLHLTGNMSIQLTKVNEENLAYLKTLGNNFYLNGNREEYMSLLVQKLQDMGYSSNHDSADRSVTLDCSNYEGGVPVGTLHKTYFVMSIRPGAFIDGFKVTLNYNDGSHRDFTFSGKEYIVRPGTFTNINIFD